MSEQEPRLSAADEELVRRALAGSAPEPLPEDVAARLDDVLASLVAEHPEPGGVPEPVASPTRPVARLDRHRRRRWPLLVVAAAAVALITVGAGDLVRSGGGGASSPDSAAVASRAEAGAAAGSAGSNPPGVPLPVLRSATLAADVRRVARETAPTDRAAAAVPDACAVPPHHAGDRVLLVRLDGAPATLVLGGAGSLATVGRVYPCAGDTVPLATVRIPRS